MPEVFACEFCGRIYETKKELAVCRKEALRMRPKHKVGSILYHVDEYGDNLEDPGQFRMLKVLRWRPNFNEAMEEIIGHAEERLGTFYSNFVFRHCFIYVLQALNKKTKNIDFTKRDTFRLNRVEHGITPGTKGIALKFEHDLETKPREDD